MLSRRTCAILICSCSWCMHRPSSFWDVLTMWDWEHVFSKILQPKLPSKHAQKSRKRTQQLSNPRKSDFWSLKVIWVLQTMHFAQCLKENVQLLSCPFCPPEFTNSAAGLATQDWSAIVDSEFPYGAITMTTTCFSKDPRIAILWL